MALRSSWRGFLRLSLVSVPVKAFNAVQSGDGRIHLNQLHSTCHRRIRYQKVCPEHGEVPSDEIVTGYEYAKDKYVVVDRDDMERARTPEEKAVAIEMFVKPDLVDPLWLDGRNYYLTPDGPVGQKPYALLHSAMKQEGRYGIGQVALSGREELVLLRTEESLLMMSMLRFASQVKSPEAFVDETPQMKLRNDELKLARTLVRETASDKFDWSKYQDDYTEKLTEIIEAKVAGRDVVAAPAETETPVINLMDALKQSVAKARTAGGRAAKGAASGRRSAGSSRSRKQA
ncbi:MAG: Ku protein [Pirellulales bacterium]